MKLLQLIILILLSNLTIAQTDKMYGNLQLTGSKITKTEILIDSLYGTPIKMNKIYITTKRKIQKNNCYGPPPIKKYCTVKNKLSVTYAYDSTGSIYNSILSEIELYLNEKEKWAKKHNHGNDFTNLPFYKSFYLSDSIVIPFISTEEQRNGDYQIFYINGYVYKIELLESHGLGSLNAFTRHNMIFFNQNSILEFDTYIKNIDSARIILNKYNN